MTNQRRYAPKLRLLSAVLSAAMALTMLPMAAFAEDATDYNVMFAGKSVTSANAGDILGDGKASYDPDTQTLRLDGDISTPNNGVQTNLPIRIAGAGTITGQNRTGGGIYASSKKAQVVSGAEITLENFGAGVLGSGAEICGDLTIRDINTAVLGDSVTVEAGGSLTIENANEAMLGEGIKVYGTLKIDQVKTAASAGGIKVYEGGSVTITNAETGVEGSSVVDGGTFSLSAATCIGNGELTFNSGTLTLDSTSGDPIALDRLNVGGSGLLVPHRTGRPVDCRAERQLGKAHRCSLF